MLRKSILLFLGAAVAVGGSQLAHAENIAISNAGFENPVLAVFDFTETVSPGWEAGFYDLTRPEGSRFDWITGGLDGFLGTVNSNTYYSAGPVEGENAAWLYGYRHFDANEDTGIRQILGATLAAETQYVLSAQVGSPNFNIFDDGPWRLELWAGGVMLDSSSGANPTSGNWDYRTLTYYSDTNPAQLGGDLEIRLFAVAPTTDGSVHFDDIRFELHFDDVSLTARAIQTIPEPSTLVLAALGLLGLLGFVRRRRR